MSTKTAILVVAAILVVVSAVSVFFILRNDTDVDIETNNPDELDVNNEQGDSATWNQNIGVVDVPGFGETVPEDVASPTVVGPGSANVDSSYRRFNISVENNKFIPENIIVKQKDIVNLNISAVDKNYDFTQPEYGLLKLPLELGKTKVIEFQASSAGKFTFYCESCGGPEKGPVGYLIVSE